MSADAKRQAPRDTRCRTQIATALLATGLQLITPAAMGKGSESASLNPSKPEVSEKQADLKELREKIETLRKSLSANEDTKADAATRLRASEREISRLQRELHELNAQRDGLQDKLDDLNRQSSDLGKRLEQQQAQLEKLLYRQYLRGSPDAMQLLLNGGDPSQMARDLRYLSAIGGARADLMAEIRSLIAQKQALARNAQERSEELAALASEQQKNHQQLQQQRDERKAVFAQISDKVKTQREQIGNLQQDEQRLSKLIDQLSRILAARAAEAARAAKAAKEAEAARQAASAKAREKPGGKMADKPAEKPIEKAVQKPSIAEAPPRPAATAPENRLEPVTSDGSFVRLRGNMRLPVRGTIAGRFGAARDGGGTWRGLFIRAGSGSEVKSVAAGRVVFAEWMRGFGNLLIVDHGDGYLSIYGNNESLLKEVGQKVRGGDTIASVGNSGGNPDSGLYFELRHQGQPIDPLKWASLK